MTPNDIVGMAVLNGLDMIAITDHNSLANVASVVIAAKSAQTRHGRNLIVLPGIEVSTAEEVHVLCLFGTLEVALGFEKELSPLYSTLSNRMDIFGTQLLYDESDRVTGKMERMLAAPTTISFDELFTLTQKHGGACVPAHIDRGAFSVMSNLGFFPPHLRINTVEVTPRGVENGFSTENSVRFPGSRIIVSSDAHQLWAISERKNFLILPEQSSQAAVDFLR